VARLSDRDRARLPDSAFAYIDSKGNRRLPINDESHVRNALARFDQVAFEDDAARERARKRLLNAAKRYRIVPVGFITGQIRTERRFGAEDLASLPTGRVTFLFTDIEGSTALLRQLGDGYANLRNEVRRIIRRAVQRFGGREVDTRADEFFAAFPETLPALQAAVSLQRTLGTRSWPDDLQCRVRAGIHTGRPTLTESGYVGLSVNAASRICWVGNGGQIVVSGTAKSALEGPLPDGVSLRSLGRHPLPGITRPESLYQVEAKGLLMEFPPLRTATSPEPAT